MRLALTPEQEELRRAARELLERECPTALVRALRDPQSSGHDPGLWRKLAEAGWLGVHLDPVHGGGGGSLVDLALVFEEAGRVLLPTTFASTVFASLVVQAVAPPQRAAPHLRRLASGEAVGTVALWERTALRDPAFFTARARNLGGRWVLEGEKDYVRHAHLAGLLLVAARTPQGVGVFLVPPDGPGVGLVPHATVARDRQFALRLEGAELPGDALLGPPDAWPALQKAVDRMTALQCAEMVGGASRVLEMTVQHVKTRHQFGRPLGSFQAVRHHVANMATWVEGARWASYQAAWRLARGLPARRAVAVAKAWTSEAYKNVTVLAHQLHGGAGYVVEHDLHLWSERAKETELWFGPRDVHLGALAGELLA